MGICVRSRHPALLHVVRHNLERSSAHIIAYWTLMHVVKKSFRICGRHLHYKSGDAAVVAERLGLSAPRILCIRLNVSERMIIIE
jgi:hypothetical protein